MADLDYIRDSIVEEVLKHDEDIVNTLKQSSYLRVEIEAGFFSGVWQIDEDEIVSNIYIRDEKQNDLVDLELLSNNLNRMKNYSWMLNAMQSKLVKQ